MAAFAHRHGLTDAVAHQGPDAEAGARADDRHRVARLSGLHAADIAQVAVAQARRRQGQSLKIVDQPRRAEAAPLQAGLRHHPTAVGQFGLPVGDRAGHGDHRLSGPVGGTRLQIVVDRVFKPWIVGDLEALRIDQADLMAGRLDQGEAAVGASDVADEAQVGPRTPTQGITAGRSSMAIHSHFVA
jgi:hypothetical protein